MLTTSVLRTSKRVHSSDDEKKKKKEQTHNNYYEVCRCCCCCCCVLLLFQTESTFSGMFILLLCFRHYFYVVCRDSFSLSPLVCLARRGHFTLTQQHKHTHTQLKRPCTSEQWRVNVSCHCDVHFLGIINAFCMSKMLTFV